ncbi:hypothetical protein [Lapidilactobacillus wuchangensis]|uniref:hypothetical protein n=1 Tax=Lapidilactobacillus wuchangensis TaxID=2486001 RepID=UPI0013DE20DF|nr:hypothetical protein [Lapidilactobacillus wuchangensis]
MRFCETKAQINAGRVPRQAARNAVRTSSVLPSSSGFNCFELWSLIGSNRCRPRSTTSKPGMQSDSILFQNQNVFA